MARADPTEGLDGKALEDFWRDAGRQALDEGRFEDGFSNFHASILSKAIRWFREEGVQFARATRDITPTELLIGLAVAADEEVRARGEEASNKLSAAMWALGEVAKLRLALDEETPLKPEVVHRKLAQVIMSGVALGQMDGLMTTVELGWLDKLAQFEIDRDRKRAGAEVVNRLKAGTKDRALAEAMRIAGRNPTLSNEALARKVVESAKLNTSIRTATEWVREWRRRAFLDPQTGT